MNFDVREYVAKKNWDFKEAPDDEVQVRVCPFSCLGAQF